MKFLQLIFLIPCLAFGVPAPANRQPSTPFISGDTFRFFSDYVFDELDTSFDPEKIERGSTIFVKTDYLGRFFQEKHPRIQNPYILISHNSDDAAPGPYAAYLDDPKLLAWFGQNYDGYPHAKMHPIPIGLANFHWTHGNFHNIVEVQQKKLPKYHLAYMNIAIGTYPRERQQVHDLLARARFCFKGAGRKHKQFLEDLSISKFVISPRGNGLDTHRLWETLYVGSIPVVKSSPLDPLYDGLPVLVINDWTEVSESFLKAKEAEISQKPHFPERITIQYWMDKINAYKTVE